MVAYATVTHLAGEEPVTPDLRDTCLEGPFYYKKSPTRGWRFEES